MKKLLVLVLAVALVFSLAACKAKVDSESDLGYVKGKGSIIIGYTDYEPMNFTDENGVFTGFDTELAQAVCAKLGIAPEFVEINWDTKEVELNAKTIDCIWNGLTITPARQKTMSITDAYLRNTQVLVMKADASFVDTSSLIGKTVCAEAGSAGEEVIIGDDEGEGADENLIKAHYVAKALQTECLMEVAAGTADAAVLDFTLANAMTGAGTNYANLVIKANLTSEEYGVAFRKGSDLCDKVNGIFKELMQDGTMQLLADKYELELVK